jgi:hypothetical protein
MFAQVFCGLSAALALLGFADLSLEVIKRSVLNEYVVLVLQVAGIVVGCYTVALFYAANLKMAVLGGSLNIFAVLIGGGVMYVAKNMPQWFATACQLTALPRAAFRQRATEVTAIVVAPFVPQSGGHKAA